MPFFFLFGDYQGSAQLMLPDLRDGSGAYDLPESAAHIQRNAYTPYGSQRALNTDLSNDSPDVTFDASLSIERGWLSQVADEATSSLGTGLTYLNARYYDPVASRFISPDPLLDVMDPKTLDPYRYAENNPVFYTDATGLSAESVCGQYGCVGRNKPGDLKAPYTSPASYRVAKRHIDGGDFSLHGKPTAWTMWSTVAKWEHAQRDGSQDLSPAKIAGCWARSNCANYSAFNDMGGSGRPRQNIYFGVGSRYSNAMPSGDIAAQIREQIDGGSIYVGRHESTGYSVQARGKAGPMEDLKAWSFGAAISMINNDTSNWDQQPLADSIMGSVVSKWTVVDIDPDTSLATIRVTTMNVMSNESAFREASAEGYENGAQNSTYRRGFVAIFGEVPKYDVSTHITWEMTMLTNP